MRIETLNEILEPMGLAAYRVQSELWVMRDRRDLADNARPEWRVGLTPDGAPWIFEMKFRTVKDAAEWAQTLTPHELLAEIRRQNDGNPK